MAPKVASGALLKIETKGKTARLGFGSLGYSRATGDVMHCPSRQVVWARLADGLDAHGLP